MVATRCCVLLMIFFSGACVVGGKGRPARVAGLELAPGVDRSKAFLSLEAIRPPVTVPSGTPNSEATPLSERGANQLSSAKKLIDQQRFTEASLELERALRYDPHHPEILRALMMLHWQAGNLERARTQAQRMLELDPGDPLVYYILGRTSALSDDLESAQWQLRTALAYEQGRKRGETLVLIHYHLADVLAAAGYLSAALVEYSAFEQAAAVGVPSGTESKEYQTLIRSTGGSTAEQRSSVLERLGRFGDAADVLAASTPPGANHPDLAVRRADLLLRAGRAMEALAVVRGVERDDEQVLKIVVEAHRHMGQPAGVVEDLRQRLVSRPQSTEVILFLADALVGLDRVDDARMELNEFLRRHPDIDNVRGRLIELQLASEDWWNALRTAAAGLERQPDRWEQYETTASEMGRRASCRAVLLGSDGAVGDSPSMLYLLGVVARDGNQLDRAEPLWNAALNAEPGYVPARIALAALFLGQLRYDDVLRIASRLHEGVAEDHRLEYLLGTTHDRLDQVEKAELHYKAAAQLERGDPRADLALARLYENTDRSLLAQRQLRSLLSEHPDHEAARERLAILYLREGKRDLAIQEFTTLARNAQTLTTKVRSETFVSQYPGLEPVSYRLAVTKAMEDSTPDAASWIAIAESYDPIREPEPRREAYQKAHALDPENEEAAIGLVNASMGLLEFERAIEHQRALLPRRPNRHPWFGRLIELLWIVQDYDGALEAIQGQLAKEDLDSQTRNAYRVRWVETLQNAGRGGEAIDLLKQWADAEGGQRDWLERLAHALEADKQTDRAVDIWESLHASHPGDRRILDDLIEAHMAAGQHDRAAQYALDWLAEDPLSEQALRPLILVLADQGRIDDVQELIRDTLQHTTFREAFQGFLVAQLSFAGRQAEALDFVDSLLDEIDSLMRSVGHQDGAPDFASDGRQALRPNEPFLMERLVDRLVELRVMWVSLKIDLGQFREAEHSLQEWLDVSPDPGERIQYLRALAGCYQAAGRDEDSTEALAGALALRPDLVMMNNDVAYGWIDRGVRLDEAERLIRLALARSPREGAYLDTFGWLLYKKGEFQEARKWLTRAHRTRSGDDPVVLDHLGDACWRLGDAESALGFWTRAVEGVRQMPEQQVRAADIRRVRDLTPRKIDRAREGGNPDLAPTAKSSTGAESTNR